MVNNKTVILKITVLFLISSALIAACCKSKLLILIHAYSISHLLHDPNDKKHSLNLKLVHKVN
jgi:hypothetical protein